MGRKELILILIREELRNRRFVISFEEMGFDCSVYALNISHVILDLAGFTERTEELYEWYFNQADTALKEMTFWNLPEMLDKWPAIIYHKLKERKRGKK